jgi:hypothetical protein
LWITRHTEVAPTAGAPHPVCTRTSCSEELDAFDTSAAKVVAAVRERRYRFDPTKAS